MTRTIFAFCIFAASLGAQNFPALNWVQEVGGTGADTFAGLAVDAQGNTFVAGTTSSPVFPVKNALQPHLASAGVVRIQGSSYATVGSAYSLRSLALDQSNANILYASSQGAGVKSIDGGNTWAPLAIPSTQIQSFAIDPSNDQNIYAAAFDLGAFKSTDAGVTWTAINNGLTICGDCSLPTAEYGAETFWIDPNTPDVVFLFYANSTLARSADGGASWQTVGPVDDLFQVFFDTPNPGVLYLYTFHNGTFKSTDDGQTYQPVTLPVSDVFADPRTPGRLLGDGTGGIFESDDDGVTWGLRLQYSGSLMAADWVNGFLYAEAYPSGILQISANLATITPIGPPAASGYGLVESAGIVYAAGSGGSNAFVAKLDSSGNVIFATYFGGSTSDIATAMAVDSTGSVYVTGTTRSPDFPLTKGAYATSGSAFLFKLNPDGSVNYSTYFPAGQSTPAVLQVDGAGAAYITGSTFGGLPVTPGAYQTACACSISSNGFFGLFETDGFITKFDPAGATLVYSTYLGIGGMQGNALALARNASVYVGGPTGLYELNPTGSALVATAPASVAVTALAVAPDGSVYASGAPMANQFAATSNAFETAAPVLPSLPYQGGGSPPAGVVHFDSALQNILAATYFGGVNGSTIESVATDSAGNVYIGGSTAAGLPLRTPLFEPFSNGFLAELSGDLSSLLFSTYLGSGGPFSVQGVAVTSSGSVVIGGVSGIANSDSTTNVWANSLTTAPPPALRVDSILNAASLIDGAISPGETIVVRGAGFSSGAVLSIGGETVTPLSIGVSQMTAVVPADISGAGTAVQAMAGGAASNVVAVPVAAASPGLFSADGSGLGQGYILNQDGSLNTRSNPAQTGDRITIFATGVGALSLNQGYAVTASPVNVFIDGFYCNGVAAVIGPVSGFPGMVYQLTVLVPSPAALVANNPDLQNFTFPPLDGIVLQIAGKSSQNGLAISIGN